MRTLINRFVRTAMMGRCATVSTSASTARRQTKPASLNADALVTDWTSAVLSYDNLR